MFSAVLNFYDIIIEFYSSLKKLYGQKKQYNASSFFKLKPLASLSPIQNDPVKTYSNRWLMLFGVWILYFCFGLTAYSLAPLVRPITLDLNMNYTEMGRVFGTWQLLYIFTAMPCGSFIDRLGLRKSLLISAVIIGFSCLARSFAEGPLTLLIAVAFFGLGGGSADFNRSTKTD